MEVETWIPAALGSHGRISEEVLHRVDWKKMALYLEEKYGGQAAVARVWNKNYAKLFDGKMGDHHWVPEDIREEYIKIVEEEDKS